jgi:predicted HTH transcriptional regulator
MANTDGGVAILGMRERKGLFEPVGIENVDKVRAELFNNLNNRQKVSINLLTDAQVPEWTVDGRTLLVVDIPRARRQQRPVYLTRNPLDGNTYRRLNEGDRPLPDEEVKRMLAEQVEGGRQSRRPDFARFRLCRSGYGQLPGLPPGVCQPWNLATLGTKRTIRSSCA